MMWIVKKKKIKLAFKGYFVTFDESEKTAGSSSKNVPQVIYRLYHLRV